LEVATGNTLVLRRPAPCCPAVEGDGACDLARKDTAGDDFKRTGADPIYAAFESLQCGGDENRLAIFCETRVDFAAMA
jgi:hypothetical protein